LHRPLLHLLAPAHSESKLHELPAAVAHLPPWDFTAGPGRVCYNEVVPPEAAA